MLTLVVVVAHPDDDAYGIAGTVALHADEPGFRFVQIHATNGEGGDIRPGFPATPETLGGIRRAENEAGWRAVGRSPDRHVWLGYPDGGVDRVPPDELVDAVWAVLEQEQPAVVFTFGPTASSATPITSRSAPRPTPRSRGARQARARRSGGCCMARSRSRCFVDGTPSADMSLPAFEPTRTYHMRGVPDEQIGVVVDCRGVAHRIVAGLREHRSQHHVMSDDPDDVERWERIVSREWHVVAWPPRAPFGPCLTDVFEGLS